VHPYFQQTALRRVHNFELSSAELASIDALDTGVRRGPDPASITLCN